MAYPVYSERFLSHNTPNTWQDYFVPAGKRMVVRWLVAQNTSATAQLFQVILAGKRIYNVSIPVSAAPQIVEYYCVAYPGEAVSAHIGSSSGAITVSGFLFDIPAGLMNEPPPTQLRADGEELTPQLELELAL